MVGTEAWWQMWFWNWWLRVLQLDWETARRKKPGTGLNLWKSKAHPHWHTSFNNAKPTPTRSHLLIPVKWCPSLMRGHSYQNHTMCIWGFLKTSILSSVSDTFLTSVAHIQQKAAWERRNLFSLLVWRNTVLHGEQGMAAGSRWSHCIRSQEDVSSGYGTETIFALLFSHEIPPTERNPTNFRWIFPPPLALILRLLHRQGQWFISTVPVNPIKLPIKMTHHIL